MNRREMILGTIAATGGGYALWDIGVLSLPDGVEAPDTEVRASETTPSTPTDSAATTTTESTSGFFEPEDWSRTPKLAHERINEFRSEEGRTELRWSPVLADMATNWAEEMQSMNRLEHRNGDLIQTASQYGAQCDMAGENIAQTWVNENLNIEWEGETRYTTPEELATGLFKMWESSTGHRENMLEIRFTQGGIGVVVGDDGKVWAVQNFC